MLLISVMLFALIGLDPDEVTKNNLHPTLLGPGTQSGRSNLRRSDAFGVQMIDLTGRKFSRLTVLEFAERTQDGRHVRWRWRCRCDCGNSSVVTSDNLLAGHVRSCGCLSRETTSRIRTTHGATRNHSRTQEYRAWCSMKERCLQRNNRGWKDYGGRGIRICARWLNSFENFISDMGLKPSRSLTLGRIDNNGNYCPSNCRWETRSQQNRNYRRNHVLTYRGRSQTMIEWSEEVSIQMHTLSARIRAGWSVERAITTPVL